MSNQKLEDAMAELAACRKKVADIQRAESGETVGSYTLKDADGNEVEFASLFGDKDDLIVVHNMGQGCRYCTLWADGFNGYFPHLENRAAFVLVSPDAPEKMAKFAEGRGWRFRMFSNHGGTFTRDMGFENENGGPLPGVSTFHRDANGKITRVSRAFFGPGDEFCAVWPLFDMLRDGVNGWEPQYSYE